MPESNQTLSYGGTGSNQEYWRRVAPNWNFDRTSDLSAPGAFAYSVSIWTDTSSGSSEKAVLKTLPPRNAMAFRFWGDGQAGHLGMARLWGISELTDGTNYNYVADYLCDLTLTLGPTRTLDGGILPYAAANNERLVKAIDVVVDRSLHPGVRVVGQEGDAWPQILLDGMGHLGYILEMTNKVPTGMTGTATSRLGAVYRPL